MRRRLTMLCISLCAAASGLGTQSAVAAPSAVPVFPTGSLLDLSAPGVKSYYAPDAVIDANTRGDAVVAWTISQQRSKYLPSKSEVQVAFRSAADPTGAWSAPQTLSLPDSAVTAPQVGIDDLGVATIAWSEWPAAFSPQARVRVVTHAAGKLGAVQEITAEHETLTGTALSVAPDGQAVLAYLSEQHDGSPQPAKSQVVALRRASSAGEFANPQTVSSQVAGAATSAPTVASGPGGASAVVWLDIDPVDYDGRGVELAQSSAGGAFGASVDVSALDATTQSTARVGNASLLIDPAGTAIVTWNELQDITATDKPFEIVARRVNAGGELATRQVLRAVPSGSYYLEPRASLGVDASGQVTAAWSYATPPTELNPTPSTIQAATAPPGASFGPSSVIRESFSGGVPKVAVDASGTTVIALGGSRTPPSLVWRPAGSDAFIPVASSPTPGWVTGVAPAFGRPDELTVVLDYDLAPLWVVKAATWTLQPVPQPSLPSIVPDTTKPVLSIKKIATTKATGKKGKKKPGRLTVALGASEPVSVRSVVTQRRKGVKKGATCVKRPSSPKKRKGRKSCTRTVVIGPEVLAPVAAAGSTLDLGAAPSPGTYLLTVKSTDAAGNGGDVVTREFTVR